MWNLSHGHLRIRRMYISALIILALAATLGAAVGVYWRDEYARCLAVSGGFQRVLTGECTALP